MPVREIKTTLTLDGEKQFKQELADAGRQMRVMNADLKAMAAEFENADDKQRYYEQRTETLNAKVKQQSEIVRALNEAVKRSKEIYGDAAKETDGYRIRLSNATEKLFQMRREAEEAARELEELGRDSNKIGRQMENGIGDAAENVSGKLDNMFDKVAGDVNAIKGSVAWQTTMSVGEFVFDSIQSVMGFVQENQEFNRRIAQTRSVVEMYGYNADEIMQIAKDAASVTGDFENAQEALVNLAAAGFENEEQIKATVQSLLGVWLSAGGTLDFSGLAEDYLESVKEKTPTGTYAEAIIKFTDRSVEDVQKVLESMKSNTETLEAATAVLTEAGMQTVAEEYKSENEEIVKAEEAAIELATSAANLALELQPAVTALVQGTKTVVDGLTEVLRILNDSEYARKALKEDQPEFADALESGQLDTFGGTVKFFIENLIPSAGAETMPDNATAYGEKIGSTVLDGFESGLQDGERITTAADAAVQTALYGMSSETTLENAKTAGKNLMTEFGNGIAEGAGTPIGNVQSMVNQINAILNSIATPAYGLGWGGITGGNIALYMDSQKVGALTAGTVSKKIGMGVQTQMTLN